MITRWTDSTGKYVVNGTTGYVGYTGQMDTTWAWGGPKPRVRTDYTALFVGKEETSPMEVEKIIFNEPATIVVWKDKTKTVVKCDEDDIFDPVKGIALCYMKKAMGNKGSYNNVFRKWIPGYFEDQEELKAKVKKLQKSYSTSPSNIFYDLLKPLVDG